MIRAVLDTNVLVSGFAGYQLATSTPGELIRRWRRRDFTLVVSHHLLAEVDRTLTNPYFARRLPHRQITGASRLLRTKAELTAITVTIAGVATHPEDDLVLAAAVSAKVDYLVTGDRQLLQLRTYRGIILLSPRAFLTYLEGQPREQPPAPNGQP